MKTLFAILVTIFMLLSCQKEITGEITDGPNPVQPVVTGSFKATINGTGWTADKYSGAAFSTAGNGLPRLLNITGLSNDRKFITITLADSGVHKYTLSDNSLNVAVLVDSTLTNNAPFTTNQGPAGSVGTVEVTSVDAVNKTISGTFSFKVYRLMDSTESDITEGSFMGITYTDGAILPPATTTDTFTAKINDTLFKPFSVSGIAVSFGNTITVQGSDSLALRNVSITVPDTITPGTYSMDGFQYIGLYNNGTYPLGSSSGTLEILEHNTATKRIRGNFSFDGEYLLDSTVTAKITAGYFSVKYQ